MFLSSCPVGGFTAWDEGGAFCESGAASRPCHSAAEDLLLPDASEPDASEPESLAAEPDRLRFRVGGIAADQSVEQRAPTSNFAAARAPQSA